MKRVFFVGVVALVSGCVSGPIAYVHKTGSTVSERQAALDQCRIHAIRLVPQASRSVYTPGFHTPGTTQCNAIGSTVNCKTYGGVNIPGRIDTVDDNEGLRQRAVNSCLADRGFKVVEMPVCQGKKDYEGDSQPPLSQLTCATPRLQN